MNSRPFIRGHQTRGAFTLIELLAATAVLSLLLVVIVQLINSVIAVTAGTSHHLDSDSQARLAFDRMAVDFAQIVKRTDVDYFFVKKTGSVTTPGNDQMAFYSESSGYYPSWVTAPAPQSNASLVGYCIQNCQLQRLNKALVWNGVTQGGVGTSGPTPSGTMSPVHPMTFLPQTLPAVWPLVFDSGSSQGMSASKDGDYQTIGESIFRMEICYLMPKTASGTTTATVLSDTPYLVPGATPVPVPPPTSTPYNGMRDVAAVVVTLAVLDDTSRLIIPSTNLTNILNAAGAKFEDDGVGGATPATLASTPARLWQVHIDNGDLVAAGMPKRAASQVRIYERYFPLGNAQ